MTLKEFDPKAFAAKQVESIKKVVGNERALIAVSGVYYDVTPKPPATIEME
ncbi:hypothetical protein MUO71_06575 [Candidatus Bathyarchaeota archaeon]|nr:hypothetical protein [Candidatus Bathyarchaeota archaeon]